MTTFVLIPGAGGAGEIYWREVVAELERSGHTAIPVEIAGDDPALGLPEYAEITDEAIGDHPEVVLVAQSMGGFTAPMVRKLDRVSQVIFVNAMIPLPGETPGEWFDAVGQQDAFVAAAAAHGREPEFDVDTVFLHDIPDDVRVDMVEADRDPAETPFGQPCTFERWPDIPLHVLVGADDRLFPADLQVRVAQERLHVDPTVIPGGHLVAKSRPVELVERILDCVASPVPFTLDDAAEELRRVADGVQDDQLDAPTPCADWTVRDLAAHTCGLARAFTHTARHEPADGPPEPGGLSASWREELARDLDALVEAWREPDAWRGDADAGGVTMPSAELAVVVLDELVLHGWDLAQATGQEFAATDRDVSICTSFAEAMSTPETLDSREGLFGPIVATDPNATPFTTFLGLTGRDSSWMN